MHFSALLLAVLPLALAAPVLTPRSGQVIPGKYIIKMKADASSDAVETAISKCKKTPKQRFAFGGFKGFAAEISDDAVSTIADMDDASVEYIEKDAVVTTMAYVSQTNAPWGLGRISHRAPGSTTYVYDNSAGSGTCSYIIDTGIDVSHPEFQGRASFLANYADDGAFDGNGHGTHVAGTVGSRTYGVAKSTRLFAVKVLNSVGSGSNSGVISGINFAANDQRTRSGCASNSVANLSLGGTYSAAVNSAVRAATSAGLFMAVAAGNEAQNAANVSPASEPSACTVGATDINDVMASFSNYGSIVDIFAPGVNILSTWLSGTTNTISGTSMATPHVAGLGAYLLRLEGSRTPAALCARIKALSTTNRITRLGAGSPNQIAFNGNPTG